MKKFGLHIAILLFTSHCFGQSSEIDSLFAAGQVEYSETQLNIESLSNLQKAYNLSLDTKDNYRLDEISSALGDYFYEYGLYEEAIDYYQKFISEAGDSNTISNQNIETYRKIGQAYSSIGKPDSAFLFYNLLLDHVKYPEKLDVLRDLVDIYADNEDYRRSLRYNLEIEELLLQNDGSGIALSKIYNNIGFNYHSLKSYKLSISYFIKALNVNAELSDERKSLIYRNLGVCYFNLGDYSKSLSYLEMSEEIVEDPDDLAEIDHLIATVYMAKNDFFYALEYLDNSLNNINTKDNPYLLSEIYSGYTQVYNKTHEYDLAFDYYQKYSTLSDSLKFLNQLNQKRIIDNQKYIERTEKENRLYKAQQDFQKLKIAQLEVQARNQQLITQSLRADSIQRITELNLALKESEIAKASEAFNKLEIARQKNLILLTSQQLEIAKANEANAKIEGEKQQKEVELAQQKLFLQQRSSELKDEQLANEQKAKEIEISKITQRNVAIVAALLAAFALFLVWAYRSKRKDNERISSAYDNLSVAQRKLVAAEAKIKGLLKQQVSGAVAEALITNNDPTSVDERFVCVMFIDIRNFTVFCEGRKPSEIIEYQNSVFGFMIDIIEKNYGVVNQLMGDGFMATFGAPISKGNDCLNAFVSANLILKTLESKVESKEVFPTNIGIGLHAGNVVTGNVGNEDRKQYSITGNTVILAARLEQLNKQYGSSMIYSREVYDALPVEQRETVEFESVMVKGRSKPIEIAVV